MVKTGQGTSYLGLRTARQEPLAEKFVESKWVYVKRCIIKRGQTLPPAELEIAGMLHWVA